MITIILKPTRLAKQEFNFIDFEILAQCVTTLINNINYNKINRTYTIKVNVSNYPAETPNSHYLWHKNTINIINHNKFKKPYLVRRFIHNFIHELKHWSQDKLLKVSFFKNYASDGRAYYKCPLERDAREYTKLMLNATIQHYNVCLLYTSDAADE